MHTTIRQTEQDARSIFALLLSKGFDATLTFFCTVCVFSMD
ncbi:MAG TPA: hypothetical protein VK149_09985 [Sideroxyarcus sp.]|nr:hypothetical protein [Sideroxyarcus sp.]